MKLDLHGVIHAEVDRMVENFILLNQSNTPLTIICGNSNKMIDLVNAVIERIGCDEVVMDYYGVIIVRRV
jgi:hypothetical protein|tara:strand:+ start:190 stop:399 length:210 start_codon:yes stop_codon:yes gene_type:complete